MIPWQRRQFVGATLAAVAVAAALATLGLFGWAPVEWRSLDATTRNGVLLPALVVSVVAAHMGWVTRRTSVVVGPLAARTPVEVYLQQLRPLLLCALGGYALGMAPAVAVVASRATYGTLNVAALVGAFVALAALTCVALAVAHAFSSRFSLMVVPACTLFVAVGPSIAIEMWWPASRHLLRPAVVWFNGLPTLGGEQTLETSLLRAGHFALFAVAAVAVGLWVVGTMRPGGAVRAHTLTAAALGAAALASAVTLSLRDTPLAHDDVAAPACESRAHVTVCLHPAQRDLAPVVLSVVAPLHELLEAGDPPPVVYQQNKTKPQDPQARELPGFFLDSEATFKENLAHAVARDASGQLACWHREQRDADGADEANGVNTGSASLFTGALTNTVAARVLGTRQAPAQPYDPGQWQQAVADFDFALLDRMTDAQLRDWYTENRQWIQTCTYLSHLKEQS